MIWRLITIMCRRLMPSPRQARQLCGSQIESRNCDVAAYRQHEYALGGRDSFTTRRQYAFIFVMDDIRHSGENFIPWYRGNINISIAFKIARFSMAQSSGVLWCEQHRFIKSYRPLIDISRSLKKCVTRLGAQVFAAAHHLWYYRF